MRLSKEEKVQLKVFKLQEKKDFIIYLNEIIARTYKCLHRYKEYLHEMDEYIKEHKKEGKEKIYIDNNDYGKFQDCISNIDGYIVNLIGDTQKESISYINFRTIIKKRKNKGSLGFEIKDLDKEVEEMILHITKTRNWINHVPQSLLCSEEKLRDEGKINFRDISPIIIYMFEECELELLEDLYNQSEENYGYIKKIFSHIKKDYSNLIGESVRIFTKYEKYPNSTRRATGTKLSAHVQGLIEEVDKK
ncbi:hypothetical protein [Niameybacter massiliensis]|uniref:hypothetical protein n=1 Tax=Niameybacter massiliensis TaxID=1658108 RepID=UPI0006B5349E|nr:hypothetical protein [Niameybacter massiliensis]